MKMLTRRGVPIEEMRRTHRAEPDADGQEARTLRPLRPLQAAGLARHEPSTGRPVSGLGG